eukprot:TRINITY_DN7504_c0_g1_i1.p1 TRINITY_DN7504_c0_g1~~TRINITY_DN7504_c0_g1_i1.p1  ORF type:complete len:499 (-),score=61.46 TRINITY_DN7504_c0_g1_i1:41-1465(-)
MKCYWLLLTLTLALSTSGLIVKVTQKNLTLGLTILETSKNAGYVVLLEDIVATSNYPYYQCYLLPCNNDLFFNGNSKYSLSGCVTTCGNVHFHNLRIGFQSSMEIHNTAGSKLLFEGVNLKDIDIHGPSADIEMKNIGSYSNEKDLNIIEARSITMNNVDFICGRWSFISETVVIDTSSFRCRTNIGKISILGDSQIVKSYFEDYQINFKSYQSIDNVANVTIEENNFHGSNYGSLLTFDYLHANSSMRYDVVVRNNDFYKESQVYFIHGIYAVDTVLIENNFFHTSSGNKSYLTFSIEKDVPYLVIRDNLFEAKNVCCIVFDQDKNKVNNNITITMNNFQKRDAEYPCALRHSNKNANIDATNNYFGSEMGPGTSCNINNDGFYIYSSPKWSPNDIFGIQKTNGFRYMPWCSNEKCDEMNSGSSSSWWCRNFGLLPQSIILAVSFALLVIIVVFIYRTLKKEEDNPYDLLVVS